MCRKGNHGQKESDSFIEVRLLATVCVAIGLLGLLIPPILRAVDANGDNLDDAWEYQYGITTNAYAMTNLVGWWQLDGGTHVVDRSANQIDGTPSGFGTNAYGAGLFSNALYFTPQGRVDFPANPALNTTSGMTFSAWFRTLGTATNEAAIASWVDTRTNSWSVGIATNGVAEISFADVSGNVQTVGPSTNSATLYDGAWHHLAATWAPGQEARIYVDGENEDSRMVVGWTPGSVSAFQFGAPDSGATNQEFILDEVRLYNRALGPEEITQLPVTYTDLNGSGLNVLEDFQKGLDPHAPYNGMPLPASTNVATADPNGEAASSGFTPWMSDPQLHDFMRQFDSDPPGHHPNYWDKGHWINAVEGRWHDGEIQYRITYGPVPPHRGLWWYWYLGIGEAHFNRLAKENAADGFTLLDANSFAMPDGTRRYQGVWHKVIPPKKATNATNSISK